MASKKTQEKSLFDRFYESWISYIYPKLRQTFSKYDESDNVVMGHDVRNYFGPKLIKMGELLPLANDIIRSYNRIENVVIVAVERKGFALLGAMFDEIDSDDIKPLRNKSITSTDIKGKNVILFDDACKTGDTLISNVETLKELGALDITAFIVLCTKDAYNIIQNKHIKFTAWYLCSKNNYSKIYTAFYDMVNTSIVPVTGEPYTSIDFDLEKIDSIPETLAGITHGTLEIITSPDTSTPIRATIDYYDWVHNGGKTKFDFIGERTGFYIVLNQVKIRMFFHYKNEKMTIQLMPITYPEIPENFDCKQLKECEKESKSITTEFCRDCVDHMLWDTLIKDLLEEIERVL